MFHPTKQVSSWIGVFVHHLVETLCAPVLIFVKAVFMAQVLVSVNVPHVSIFWWNVIFLKKYKQKFLGESLVNTLFHVSDEEFISWWYWQYIERALTHIVTSCHPKQVPFKFNRSVFFGFSIVGNIPQLFMDISIWDRREEDPFHWDRADTPSDKVNWWGVCPYSWSGGAWKINEFHNYDEFRFFMWWMWYFI